MKTRFAVQRFLHLPEFSRGNVIIGVVDPTENEGFLKFQVNGSMLKMDFYSLNMSSFRSDAVNQLTQIINVCTDLREFLESMPVPDKDGLPAIGSGKKARLVSDGSDAVHTPD